MATTIAVPIVDGKLYRGASGASAGTLCDTAQDLTLKIAWDKAAANNRTSRAKGYMLTLYEISLDVSFLIDTADPHFLAFRTAVLTGTPISVRIVDKSTLSVEFDGLVESAEDPQQLAEVGTHKFTLVRLANSRPPIMA